MSTVVLVLVAGAALACPAHAWWHMRRGERACCLPAPDTQDEASTLAEQQRALADQLAAKRAKTAMASGSPTT